VSFPFNYYLLAFLGAWVTTFLTVPLWRKWSSRIGLVDDPGHRKIHDQPIALAGGPAVLTGILVPLLLGALFASFFPPVQPTASLLPGAAPPWESAAHPAGFLSYGFARRGPQLVVILLGAVAMGALGWLDDKYELRAASKLAGQILIAVSLAAAGVRITLFIPNVLFSYTITVFWIVTVTNAFNFMDNMNGLCGGLGAIGAGYFAVSAALQGQYLVALLALAACGALLGFLPYNFPKATAFLGDAGSHLTGYLLAVLAILPHFYSRQNPKTWAVFSPLLILALPLLDLVWVVILRWRAGRPIYIGDTNHLSHRLVRRGWSRPQAVVIIWILAALSGALSFL
jgi:UDP-GlcNAc:undecaprenyl-phosphate GlcNAc-1-phosphate transferase